MIKVTIFFNVITFCVNSRHFQCLKSCALIFFKPTVGWLRPKKNHSIIFCSLRRRFCSEQSAIFCKVIVTIWITLWILPGGNSESPWILNYFVLASICWPNRRHDGASEKGYGWHYHRLSQMCSLNELTLQKCISLTPVAQIRVNGRKLWNAMSGGRYLKKNNIS